MYNLLISLWNFMLKLEDKFYWLKYTINIQKKNSMHASKVMQIINVYTNIPQNLKAEMGKKIWYTSLYSKFLNHNLYDKIKHLIVKILRFLQ